MPAAANRADSAQACAPKVLLQKHAQGRGKPLGAERGQAAILEPLERQLKAVLAIDHLHRGLTDLDVDGGRRYDLEKIHKSSR